MLNIKYTPEESLVQAGGAVLVEKVMYWIRVLQEATNAYQKIYPNEMHWKSIKSMMMVLVT